MNNLDPRRTNRNPLSPKQKFFVVLLFVSTGFILPLSHVVAQEGIAISGVAKSTVGVLLDSDESWIFAAEQYANFRVTAPVGEAGNLYAAFNVIAAATPKTGIVTESEIERLYVSFRFDSADVYAGLMRIPFGYGMGIRPTDIINPQNPLFPDARLQGVLASLVSWYPEEDLRIQGFAVQRNGDYFEGQSIFSNGESLFGLSVDSHNPIFSVQGLALASVPGNKPEDYLFHFALSVKYDMVVGITFDALVTTDGTTTFTEGRENAALAAALGCDYSFLDGKFFILLQYYYTSAGLLSLHDSVSDVLPSDGTIEKEEIPLLSLHNSGMTSLRRHYGFLTAIYNHSDYARLQLSVLASPVDASCFSTIRHEFEPAQAVTLITVLAVPLDQTVFGKSNKGSLGPDIAGLQMSASFSVEYRF